MLNKNDFKKAIGQPDKAFENSVQQALDDILLNENRPVSNRPKSSKYIIPFASAIAIAACIALVFIARLGDSPDVVANSGVLSQVENSTATYSQLPDSIIPEHYDLYLSIFNQDITSIYPNYVLYRTAGNDFGNVDWYISNGTDEIKVNSVTGGVPYEMYGVEFSGYPITMNLHMRSTPEAEAAFMVSTQPWLANLYAYGYEYALKMSSISGIDYPLNGVTVSILEDGTVKYCDLHFGDRLQVYLSWTRNDDTGEYELTHSYCSDIPESYTEIKPTPAPIQTEMP